MTETGGTLDAPLFSRDQLMGGLPARRAASAIYAIANRTARLVARSRRAVERYSSEQAATQEENAFLAALADGRDPPLRPTIMDIEAHAVELGTPILGGVIPMLILLAARRRGEFATAVAPRLLAHPVTVALVAGLYIAGILFEGWVISDDPLMRIGTLAATIIVGAICVLALRSGAFRRRAVLELRGEDAGRVRYALVDAGDPAPVRASVSGPTSVRQVGWLERADLATGTSLEVDVPASEELLVWAHRVTDDGDSLPLALTVSTGEAEGVRSIDLTSSRATLAPKAGVRILTVRKTDGSGTAGRPAKGPDGSWAGLVTRATASEATA